MDSSAAREKDDSRPASLPEDTLNFAILCIAFAYKAMNCLGTLATIWATVVLLGGFSTLLKQQDFWYVTIVALVQTIGILGGYDNPTLQIFLRAPEALIASREGEEWERQLSWWRRRRNPQQQQQQPGGEKKQTRRKRKHHEEDKWSIYECRTMLGVAILLALGSGQLAAVATCLVLSSKRLKKQDYVDPQYLHKDDHRNISRSLNIFYGLVLAQGIIFIAMMLNPLVFYFLYCVRKKYRLFVPSVQKVLFRYRRDNYMGFISGNVRATLYMYLVTYAKKLAVSDSVDDKLAGIRAMDRILRSVEYTSLALMRLRASLDADALGKLVDMLGLTTTREEQDIRGHAARVVLKLAPNLLVANFPQILHLISSSLLNTASNKKMSNMDVDLVWYGLRILEKLTDNPDNCRQAKDAGDLLSKIIDLTNLCGHGSTRNTINDSWIEQEIIPLLQSEDDIPPPSVQKIDKEIIVGMSLNILSKLVAAPDDAGKELRRKTSESVHFLSKTGMILEHVEATRVIACLALDKTAREEIGRWPEIIKKLKDCVLSKTPHVNITKVAAKLLLLEYATSEQLSQIQSSIEENHMLEDQSLLLPVSAFIEELDLDHLLPRSMQRVVQKLDLEDLLSAPRVNHSEAAAEALVLLTTECEDNVAAILELEDTNLQELKMIVRMLCSEDRENSRRMLARLEGRNLHSETSRIVKKIICAEDGEHKRSMAAKLLQNLRAYSGTTCFDQHMQVIDEALPKVLKSIIDEVAKLEDPASTSEDTSDINDELWIKEGKLLESFIGLAVQICASQNASDFTITLNSADINVGTFVNKLKKILEVYRSPTTDFPGIRRCTIELMTWMVKINSNYLQLFLRCGLYEQLNEVANTATKLESFKLFHCGVGVAQHSTSISSLARELQAQLALSPNFQERSRCYGEHASTITVLVA